MDMKTELIRGATQVSIAAIAGAAAQPILTRPEVIAVAAQYAQAVVIVGGTAGLVLIAGRAAYQLQRWGRTLPPAIAMEPALEFATTHAMPAELAQMAVANNAAIMAETDDQPQRHYHNLVVRFCVIGASRRSFGWNKTKGLVDRASWDQLTRDLVSAGVLHRGKGTRPTWFNAGWGCRRVARDLELGALTLPLPARMPRVEWTGVGYTSS